MPPSFTTLTVEEEGPVCRVTLQQPLIDVARVSDLELLGDYLLDDSPAQVVVFRAGPSGFCHGIDLGEMAHKGTPDVHGFSRWERCLHTLEKLHKVTIAAIEGRCLGGGLQLALACDVRLATSTATLGLDELKRGFLPGLATWRLARQIGLGQARYLMLSSKVLGAPEARSLGLVEAVCEPGELETTLHELITSMLPVHGHAVALARRLLLESASKSYESFLGDFLAAQHKAVSSEPFLSLLRAAASSPDASALSHAPLPPHP